MYLVRSHFFQREESTNRAEMSQSQERRPLAPSGASSPQRTQQSAAALVELAVMVALINLTFPPDSSSLVQARQCCIGIGFFGHKKQLFLVFPVQQCQGDLQQTYVCPPGLKLSAAVWSPSVGLRSSGSCVAPSGFIPRPTPTVTIWGTLKEPEKGHYYCFPQRHQCVVAARNARQPAFSFGLDLASANTNGASFVVRCQKIWGGKPSRTPSLLLLPSSHCFHGLDAEINSSAANVETD